MLMEIFENMYIFGSMSSIEFNSTINGSKHMQVVCKNPPQTLCTCCILCKSQSTLFVVGKNRTTYDHSSLTCCFNISWELKLASFDNHSDQDNIDHHGPQYCN